jgi:hypothetical protein
MTKSIFDRMDEILKKSDQQRQMNYIQNNEIPSYTQPDIFEQTRELLKPKEQPKIDWDTILKKQYESERRKKANAALTKKTLHSKKNEPFLTDVKNFFTGKDTDGDGQRNGLLGAIDRFVLPVSKGATEVLAPGNNERMIRNDILKHGKVTNPLNKASLVNRGTETKVLEGAGTMLGYLSPYGKAYKAVDYGFNKVPKLAQAVTNPYLQRAIKGGTAGLLAESGLAAENELINPKANNMKDYGKRMAIGAVGGAVGDPLLHGIGRGVAIGSEKYAANVMKSLVPKGETIANEMSKAYKADNALPIQSKNTELTQLFDDFIQSRQVKAPTITKEVNVPKIGQSVDELPSLNEFSALDRSTVLNETQRPAADFSNAKPMIEQPNNYNVYGVETPKDLVETAPPEYWQKRYEDFVAHVNKNYDTNQLNREALDDLWSQFAKYDEPVTLEQVVDMAYNGYKPNKPIDTSEVWDQMGNRPQASQKAKNILGLPELKQSDNPVKTVKGINDLLPHLPEKNEAEPNFDVLRNVKVQNETQPNLEVLKNLNPKNQEQINTPLQDIPTPSQNVPNGLKERGHIETLRESENATESLKERIKGMYTPVTNEDAVNFANVKVSEGLEQATSFVKSARVLKPEHVATAHRLIQEYTKSGQIDKAVDIAEHISEQGTKAGQSVQAFSIFDKLSPEGILVHANRVADRVNAKLNPLQQKVKVTTETANQLTDLATTVQKMTQQKGAANDVINLMDKAKAGGKLTDAETKQIRQFVDDAKQWIGDITQKKTAPKATKKIINPKVKEQVISFLDSQEEAARRRLAARKNRALSGLPVDDFYDYTVIGAAKLAKGTVKFADFSEQMVREFGEEVAPYVQQIYDKASEMVNNEVKRTVNRLSEVQKITNKSLKNGKLEANDAENLRKFALSINTMSGDAKIEATQELQATLQALERPSLLQQISATQTIAQLLNPKTLVRNAVGNEIFYRMERINKLVATPIDWARVKTFGGQRAVTFKTNNQGQYWKNWLKGFKAGKKGVNPEGLSTQYDLRPNSFNGKWNPLRYMERALGASLKSFDYAGYKRAVNNTIGELATLRATNEGLTGLTKKQAIEKYIREVDENVLQIADQYGKYLTFQDNNILSVGLQKFKKGLNFGQEFGMGDLIIKYPKTPGALLARSLEYSPAGFLKSAYALAKPVFNKQFAWNDVIESFTRALIGTAGVSGIAWFLADKGILSGTSGKDFDVMELEQMAGKKEYSLNIDGLLRWIENGFNPDEAEVKENDRFITYNWAQPVATAISIGSNVNQNMKTSGEFKVGQAVYGAANGALDTMVEQSVLQGVKKAFTSYPGQTTGDKITDIAGDLPSSFVPTALNQVRQFTDNTQRNTYDPLKMPMFTNRAKNKIPVLASKLPPNYNTLGNKKEVYQGKSNSLFNVFLNPAFVSRYNPTPEAKMVLDIINNTGDTTVAPRRAQKYLTIDGKRYDLTTEQYSEYQRRLGEEVRSQLQFLVPYANTSDKEDLGKKVNTILDRAGRKVREQLKREYR